MVSRRTREEHLERVRAWVRKYQPLIEQTTEVRLGDVEVKDLEDFHQDKHAYAFSRGVIEEGLDPIEALKILKTREWLSMPKNRWSLMFDKTIMGYVNFTNAIYLNMRKEEHFSVSITIHELSHGLWDKISDIPQGRSSEEDEWSEGFAAYCQYQEFYNLYTKDDCVEGMGWLLNPHPDVAPYRRGFRKVSRAVIVDKIPLLEIPKRWRELEEKYPQENKLEAGDFLELV